jgi:hypothetical protein
MRIGGVFPGSPVERAKKGKRNEPVSKSRKDEFITQAQTASSAYSASTANSPQSQDNHLQVKNYVTTVLFRQNWIGNANLNINTMRSRDAFDFQDPLYWQPEKVAKRVVNFSKSLAKDVSKIDEYRQAAGEGFDEAIKMLGETKSIAKTKELTEKAFEDWQAEQ